MAPTFFFQLPWERTVHLRQKLLSIFGAYYIGYRWCGILSFYNSLPRYDLNDLIYKIEARTKMIHQSQEVCPKNSADCCISMYANPL